MLVWRERVRGNRMGSGLSSVWVVGLVIVRFVQRKRRERKNPKIQVVVVGGGHQRRRISVVEVVVEVVVDKMMRMKNRIGKDIL